MNMCASVRLSMAGITVRVRCEGLKVVRGAYRLRIAIQGEMRIVHFRERRAG
jgi:hypothetical protein